MYYKVFKARSAVFFLALIILAPLIPFACFAHTPHDTIDALAISRSSANDKNNALFIVRAGRHLMRSNNGGASWKELVNGIDARYDITSLAVAQNLDSINTFYMATDGDGVYVSVDTGSSWSKANAGLDTLRIQHLAVTPNYDKPPLVFAAATTGGLFRKINDGRDWQRVLNDAVKITAIAFHKHKNGMRIYIGDDSGNLRTSTDDGESWSKLIAIPDAGAINSIVITATIDTKPRILLGTENRAILRSLDGGTSFHGPTDWSFDKHVISIAVAPDLKRNATLYASTWHDAVLKSVDGGSTWEKHHSGLSTNAQADSSAFYSPHFRQIGIDEAQRAIYLAGFDGLFKSTDEGRSWQQVETEPVGNIWALSLSPAVDDDFIVAATTFDAGAYTARNSDLNWSINNYGLISTRLRKLIFSPNYANDHTVFSSEDEGDYLLRSTNDGNYWHPIRLRPTWYVHWKRKILGALRYRGVPAWLTTDLISKEERTRANPKGLAVSPNFEIDHYLYVTTRYRGNFESTDAGQSLDFAEKVRFKIWNLAMSPNFATDKTFFASARELGVYKSVDTGETWFPANKGLNFLKAWGKQAAEGTAYVTKELGRSKYYDILLAISPIYKKDKTLFVAGGEGIFKSIDGGNTWQRKGQSSLPGNYVFAIAVSPNYERDNTVVVSIKGKGLFKSSDAGATFSAFGRRLIEDNHEMRHIEFSPMYAADKTLYAVSLEDVFRSTDAGANWQLIKRPIRYENHKYDVISYRGEWGKTSNAKFSAGWASRSRAVDSSVSFDFVGTGVKWIGAQSPDLGRGEVYLDGKHVATVDQNSQSVANSIVTYSLANLPFKPHKLTVKVSPSAAAGGAENTILIDAFDVIGNRRTTK